MNNTSSSSKSSPRRRARPAPRIPEFYSSSSFSPSAQALRLIDKSDNHADHEEGANNDDIHVTLSSLRTLKDQISLHLQSTSPKWEDLTPSISSLHDALHTTQTVSSLRSSLQSMQTNSTKPGNKMESIVQHVAQLSANLNISNALSEFANLLKQADISPNIINDASPNILNQSQPKPDDHRLSDRFLQKAAALNRAYSMAFKDPLIHMSILNNARHLLSYQHTSLKNCLQKVLITSIFHSQQVFMFDDNLAAMKTNFGGEDPSSVDEEEVDDETEMNNNNNNINHKFMSIRARQNNVESTIVSQEELPNIVQALELLGGANYTKKLLDQCSGENLLNILYVNINYIQQEYKNEKDLLLLENNENAFKNNQHHQDYYHNITTNEHTNNSSYSSAIHLIGLNVFEKEISKRNINVCRILFQNIINDMINILTKLSSLADVIDSEEIKMYKIIYSIWQTMQSILTIFIQTILAFPSSNNSTNPLSPSSPPPDNSPSSTLSMLQSPYPTSKKPQISLLPASTPAKQEIVVKVIQPNNKKSINSFIDFIQDLSSDLIRSNIYNLQVIYNPLQKFIMMSTRLEYSWNISRNSEKINSQLSDTLKTSIELFIRSIRKDVQLFMKENIVNKRIGTLLQPLTNKQLEEYYYQQQQHQQQQQNEKKKEEAIKFPILLQSEQILNIIGCCVYLSFSIPNVANRIGDIINNDILMPFCERSLKAIDLISDWSDSGLLMKQIKNKSLTISSEYLEKLQTQNELAVENIKTLNENEWNSIVRLISNIQLIMAELQHCVDVENSNNSLLWKILKMKGLMIDSNLKNPLIEVVKKTKVSYAQLNEKIIEKGLLLLHCEIVLSSFQSVFKALSNLNHENENPAVEKSSNSEKQVDESPKEESYELDEFGDRIPVSSISSAYNKANVESENHKTIEFDRIIMEKGNAYGQRIKQMDKCIQVNIGKEQSKFVLKQADQSVALAINQCGRMKGKGDRDIATAVKLFLDATANVAAETMGWAPVDTDYSVAEGASQSASECRALLYAAGML